MWAPSENITNWVQEPPAPVQKPPKHVSMHDPKVPPVGSTFGLEGTTRLNGANLGDDGRNVAVRKSNNFGPGKNHKANSSAYLRKSSTGVGDGKPTKFLRPEVVPRKPAVPLRADKPVMGLQTTKNFLVANAVENILAVPKQVDNEEPRYVQKKDYGKVPEYLGQVKAAIEEEKALLEEYMQEEKQEDEETFEILGQQERQMLIHKLKCKWGAVNKEYQKMAHIVKLDTMNKLRRKEHFEKQLEELEKHIYKLESASHIVINEDY